VEEISIAFTKEELKLLLRLVYNGLNIIESENVEEQDIELSLMDKILAQVKKNKLMRGIEYDSEDNSYYLTRKGENELEEDYDLYSEEEFWDELIYRLGLRDLLQEIGEKEYLKLSVEERIERLSEYEEKYDNEFEKRGVERLRIR
jgi:hypothetical protein